MKHSQKRRIVALLLLVATFMSMMPFAVGSYADEQDGDDTEAAAEELYGGRTLTEILSLISGVNYNNYRNKYSDKTVANKVIEVKAEEALVLNGIPKTAGSSENWTTVDYTGNPWLYQSSVTDKLTGDTHTGVYTPGSGSVTFKIEVPEGYSGMYAIDLLYCPVKDFDTNGDGKEEVVSTKTTIERMFYINDKLPFSECRYLYIPRAWEYKRNDGKLSDIYRDIYDDDGKLVLEEPRRANYAADKAGQDAYEADMIAWAKQTNGGAINYEWDLDVQDNDMRPERVEYETMRTYFLRDWLGYTVEPFQFYLEEGTNYFTFESTRESLFISEIKLYGYSQEDSYEYQLQRWLSNGIQPVSKGEAEELYYMVEAESPVRVSDQVLFPGTDRTSSINSPSHPANLVYNISNSSFVGQYMTYRVYVEKEGLYNIMARFRQNTMAGMFTSRRIKINNEVQFREASYIRFNYDTSFQNEMFGNEESGDYYFYLKEGWNEIDLEVVLGDMADYIYDISNVITKMNNCYQKILQVTGTNPDTGRDYDFASLLPDVIQDLANSAMELDRIYNSLVEVTGATGQHVATIDTIRDLVEKMAKDEYEIAPNFLSFKNYVTALSNWLYTSLSQPLKLDYLRIQTHDTEMPSEKANFFHAAGHEAKAFFASFFKDYNVIGFKGDNDPTKKPDGVVLMWNTESREDALIKRTMIDSSFTKYLENNGVERRIEVEIRYVAQGLQESVLAGVGPDVANMGSGTAVSWGLRNSVEELSKKNPDGTYVYAGFNELCPVYTETKNTTYDLVIGDTVTKVPETQLAGEFVIPHAFLNEKTGKTEFYDASGTVPVQFSHAALEAVSLNEKTYLIPTNMNFEMSFYRVDIFAKEGLEPPRTWQQLLDVIPKLTTQHMTMGMQTSLAGYQMLLYQMGDTMYSADYTQFTKSNTALEAFEMLCDLFNDYSLPISYDLTRFRTGEIPLVVANWSTYNTFMGYYELRGLWTMESLIGYERINPETGEQYVDRSSILDVQGIVIPRGAKNPQDVWQYIKWYTDDDAQAELCRLNLADQNNTTVKYNTANLNALLSQAWTEEEVDAMKEQIPHLKGLPFNPGDYNIGRYISFAFLAVYNSNANAVDNFLDYVVDINKELSRKREEYHLPYRDEDGKVVVPES